MTNSDLYRKFVIFSQLEHILTRLAVQLSWRAISVSVIAFANSLIIGHVCTSKSAAKYVDHFLFHSSRLKSCLKCGLRFASTNWTTLNQVQCWSNFPGGGVLWGYISGGRFSGGRRPGHECPEDGCPDTVVLLAQWIRNTKSNSTVESWSLRPWRAYTIIFSIDFQCKELHVPEET